MMKHYLLFCFCFFLFISYTDARCKTAGWNPYWEGPPRLEQVNNNICYKTNLYSCLLLDFIDISEAVLGGFVEES